LSYGWSTTKNQGEVGPPTVQFTTDKKRDRPFETASSQQPQTLQPQQTELLVGSSRGAIRTRYCFIGAIRASSGILFVTLMVFLTHAFIHCHTAFRADICGCDCGQRRSNRSHILTHCHRCTNKPNRHNRNQRQHFHNLHIEFPFLEWSEHIKSAPGLQYPD